MPVVVLTASDKFIDVVPKLIQAGELPPDTPPDFGTVVDRANSAAQNELAALVPGAVHITDTHAGHNIMCSANVRFWGQSGHELVHCECLLMTHSGHRPVVESGQF
jgi:hypothetical protein